ncbi:FAD-dependent oxidoreductase [Aerococcaceae bacterium DSM 111020]|nr:FAD-dependent oxidoreductase [Aerococcaceae bacterium DSM 111020]
MKFVVVGTSHFGYEAVQTILKQDETAEIHLYEAAEEASFMSCGAQSYLEDIAQELDELHFANNASYADQGIHMHAASKVIDLDTETKTITVETADGTTQQSYDKLLLSPGGYAPVPKFEGHDLEHVYTFRGREDAGVVKERMAQSKKAVVIGAGYIGVEVATAYTQAGIDTVLIDSFDHILPTYVDIELAEQLEAHAKEKNLDFHGNEKVQKLTGQDGKVTGVVTDKQEYEADTVVVAIGVRPDTDWLDGIIDLDDKGYVEINENMETSAPDVYAGGDATKVVNAATGKKTPIALATNARRQGIVAALHALGKDTVKMLPVAGTSALHVFDYTVVTTGISNINKDSYDGKVASAYVEEKVYPDFMRKPGKVYMKIYFDEDTHVILGAQFVSVHDVADAINAISIAINAKWTLEQLAMVDFYYQPNYDRPWHFVQVLAHQALGNTFGGADKILF